MNLPEPASVVITGANGGIGYPMADRLLENGYRVAALDVEGDRLRSLAESHPDKFRFFRCDVSCFDEVRATVDEIVDEMERIDILVNNAAVFDFAPVEELDLEQFRTGFDINFFGYLHTIRAVLPVMRDQSEGIIHNVSSATGLAGHPGLSYYASTKGAIEALTRSIRGELVDEEIACTSMHPPLTKTDAADELDLGYPNWVLGEPDQVGKNLADVIESTGPVVTPDWQTAVTVRLIRWFPGLFAKAADRWVAVQTS